jgi:hypothetical protein
LPNRRIRIQRNKREPVGSGIVPDCAIVGFRYPSEPHLARTGKQALKPLTESEAQVLIEQKLHASRYSGRDPALAICGVSEKSADVILGEFGIVGKDLLVREAGSEPTKHVADRDPHPATTWTPASLPIFGGDDSAVAHAPRSSRIDCFKQRITQKSSMLQSLRHGFIHGDSVSRS